MNVRRSELANGLQIWTTHNNERPLINTNIVVHAGSKNDFDDATGLAHYLEHMMFKGNSQIGALNWIREKPLLDEISQLFESYAATTDPEERASIYAHIDQISNEASQFASIGEYDRLAKSIGAEGTNAFTSNDETVYHETIPSNHLEKWMYLKSVQFKQVVLRLFHTELETVYQEYNTTLSSTGTLVWDELFRLLFPDHPYGTQTTIGKPEHLKNPRPKRIMEFFAKYYVASNMAIVCSGDVDHQEVVLLAQKYFGVYPNVFVDVDQYALHPVVPTISEVYNQDFADTNMAWRVDKNDVNTMAIATVAMGVLEESAALRIQAQQAQDIDVDTIELENCFVVAASVRPNAEDQTMDDLDQVFFSLLKEQVTLWKVEAAITAIKVQRAYAFRDITSRSRLLIEAFIQKRPTDYYDELMARIETVTLIEVQTFISTHLRADKACIVHKLVGPQRNVQEEVVAPPITPIPVPEKETWSPFKAKLDAIPASTSPAEPKFTILPVNPSEIMHNKNDDALFNLCIVYSLGTDTLPYLDAALDVFAKLSTSKRTAHEVTQKYSELGATRTITVEDDLRRLMITVWGLHKNLMPTLSLLDEDILDRQPDDEVWAKAREALVTSLQDDLKNLGSIEEALGNYAVYGPHSQFRKTRAASMDTNPKRNCEAILSNLSIAVQNPIAIYLEAPTVPFTPAMFGVMRRSNVTHTQFVAPCVTPKFNMWYLYDYEGLSQATIHSFCPLPLPTFDVTTAILGDLWTEYFGNTVIFKEIREVRGLAYSARAACETAAWSDPPHSITFSLKVQTDVLEKAMVVLDDLIESPPQDTALLHQCAQSMISSIQTHRDLHEAIFSRSLEHDRLKLSEPYLKSTLNLLKGKTGAQLMALFLDFHKKYVVGKPRTYTVIVDRQSLPDPNKGTWVTNDDIF